MEPPLSDPTTDPLLQGRGEMRRLLREADWGTSPLGPPDRWSPSLRSALSICLSSPFQIALYWGPELTLLYNDAWSSIPGDKHPWALGRPAIEVWPEIWHEIGPQFQTVFATGEGVYFEEHLLPMHRHGYLEECYFDFTFTPVRGESGGVEGVFNAVVETTWRVISERRERVLSALAEGTASARSLGETCALVARCLDEATFDVPWCALYLLEPDGTATLSATSGVAEGGVPARVATDDPEAPWPFEGARRTGRATSVSGLAARFGAALRGGPWPEPADTALVAPFSAGPSVPVAGFLVAGTSPRRAVDDAYRQFVDRAAAQISAVLANVATYEAERRRAEALAELDRARTAFFSNVSHEFRTPLTLMIGPLEEALRSPEQTLSGAELRLTWRNTVRLQKLVNAVLDFSRLEAGRMRSLFEPTDLATLTADLASAFRAAMERGGLRYTVAVEELPEPVWIDRDLWEKVVLNLLSNAFKFTLAGQVRVELSATTAGARLRVVDTGEGIPADELPHLFERFHRVAGTRTRTQEGSGIGLALVNELVKLHGGSLTVDSRVGEGSTFEVLLPWGSAHLPADHVTAGSADARPRAITSSPVAPFVEEALRWLDEEPSDLGPPEAAVPSAGGRVLVVDDNADLRDYLRRLLHGRFVVGTASNGEDALERLQEQPYDLVVSDVMMPRMDGFELLRAIRSDPALRHTRVVLLSARAGEEARIDGIEAGADDYVVKPFGARELVARVAAQVELSRVGRAREQERAKLEAVFTSAPFAVALVEGPEHRVVLQNAKHRELVGGVDLVGRTLLASLPGLEADPVWSALEEACRTGEPVIRDEVRVPGAAEGAERWFRMLFQPIPDAEGTVTGLVMAGFEVTEIVRTRAALESASRAKDEFLAMLGHELRNPLAPILTALQIAKLRGETALQREREIIERQVRHMTRLVDDLLDISRITQGKVTLHPERIEIGAVIAKAIEMAEPLVEDRRHHLVVDVPARGLLVDVDPTRTSQVFSNLLTNAARYTPPGGLVTVAARLEDGAVVVDVTDTGAGIEPEALPGLFDPFVQGPRTAARSEGGLGLGLALVKRLLEIQGGTVSAQSEGAGRGSRFTVRLEAAVDARPTPLAGLGGPEAAVVAARRILLVDDNADAAWMMAELLRGMGQEVEVAHDGPEALAALDRFPADVAVVDIGLPVMDGYELARRIRASRGDGIRLVALTGYAQPQDRARSAAAGFDVHLAKPVPVEELLAALALPDPDPAFDGVPAGG